MRIGVDVGTSVVKAVLFDGCGRQVLSETFPSPLLRPSPGRFEYDIDQLVEAVFALLRSVAHHATERVDIVAVTGQGDGLWLTDDAGEPVSNAVPWLDGRAVPVWQRWVATGVSEQVFRRTANAPFAGAGAAVLAYLDAVNPRTLARATTATQCQHVIFQRLTGVRLASQSCAMMPIFDPVTGDYDEVAIAACGLTGRRGLLPPMAVGPAGLATIDEGVAADLGLGAGAVATSGPYDLPAAALGVGLDEPGDGLLIIGTTLACLVRSVRVDTAADAVGLTLCVGDGGWLRVMPAMTGTAGLDWVLRLMGARHSDLQALLTDSEPGAHGVHALPYLSPVGERAPFAEPHARGEFGGLSLDSTPGDVVRAYCEALAFASRQCLEAAGIQGHVTICGGAAATAELVQIVADTLDRPASVVTKDEPVARGALRAALLALGEDPGAVSTLRAIAPRTETVERYTEGYAQYLSRVHAARQRWQAPARTYEEPVQ